MKLKELCDKIDLAPEVQSEVLGADLRIPDELAARLISADTADKAYREIEKLCDPEKLGFDMLAYMLGAALAVYGIYRSRGIDDEIFFSTMKCFSRFVNEHKASFGYYGFDRGWWTYRQLSMTLFRIGELEYEFRNDEKTVHLHIPSDADISVCACRESAERFLGFAAAHYPETVGYPVTLSSWLISPALDELLAPDSKIIGFKNCFDTVSWDENDTDFMQWVFGRKDIGYRDLPERTSLQRNMKEYLMSGKKVGCASGVLRKFG